MSSRVRLGAQVVRAQYRESRMFVEGYGWHCNACGQCPGTSRGPPTARCWNCGQELYLDPDDERSKDGLVSIFVYATRHLLHFRFRELRNQ